MLLTDHSTEDKTRKPYLRQGLAVLLTGFAVPLLKHFVQLLHKVHQVDSEKSEKVIHV